MVAQIEPSGADRWPRIAAGNNRHEHDSWTNCASQCRCFCLGMENNKEPGGQVRRHALVPVNIAFLYEKQLRLKKGASYLAAFFCANH